MKRRIIETIFMLSLLLSLSAGVSAADWVQFQGSEAHTGVIDIETPTKAEDAAMYWAVRVQAELGWASAPSHPIIVDDVIVFFANRTIYKLDMTSGEILQEGTLAGVSSWNITMPTYGDGKIYVCLSNGRIQAVDFATLESAWLYQNDRRGQSNCTIAYHDGYVYTGFWNSPKKDADFVCVDAKTGEEVWTLTHSGGFYWAGSYVCDDYLLVGSDDGFGSEGAIVDEQKRTGVLYSVNPKTGEVLDTIDNIYGDIRSTIAMENGTAYFTSEGGSFYGVPVRSDGTFEKESIVEIDLGNTSVSTPAIHNGRAYVGVMGDKGHFEKFGGHFIAVIDLKTQSVAYKCPTAGFNQTSGVLTTAYEDRDGCVYVYFVDNYTPGKIRVIKDRPGQTRMEAAGPYADVLFTPVNLHEEYALCSPIVDEYGTMYFKNDSGYIMALGWNIDHIEVTKQPDKTEYTVGETFDPAGMEVTAYLANGKTRDITKYVEYSEEPLSEDDLDVTVSYSLMMYHDVDDGDNSNDDNRTNQAIYPEYTTVPVEVKEAVTPDPQPNPQPQPDPDPQPDPQPQPQPVNPFTDVRVGAFYYNPVIWAVEKGVTTGTTATTFSPEATCTRGQVVTFLWRASGSPEPTSSRNPFTDVKSGAFYYKAVLWAVEKGITSGTTATTFSPSSPCTRGQVATFLHRSKGTPASGGSNPFTDVKRGAFYYDAVLWAVSANVTAGTSATTFSPTNACTRGQIVTFLYRAE